MRVAHITDLHVEAPPQFAQLLSKRALGAVNLYLLGRSAHFTLRTVEALVDALAERFNRRLNEDVNTEVVAERKAQTTAMTANARQG